MIDAGTVVPAEPILFKKVSNNFRHLFLFLTAK